MIIFRNKCTIVYFHNKQGHSIETESTYCRHRIGSWAFYKYTQWASNYWAMFLAAWSRLVLLCSGGTFWSQCEAYTLHTGQQVQQSNLLSLDKAWGLQAVRAWESNMSAESRTALWVLSNHLCIWIRSHTGTVWGKLPQVIGVSFQFKELKIVTVAPFWSPRTLYGYFLKTKELSSE